ncbi:WxcM-like domain-containing protein [Flavobacterium salilacus subsp. salilacus]|uniref:sugar 3,4-ketoisomerase n=1 Tax=Flavobacterium TaxID=237 RepID=UPI001074B0F4|nr:MULTISPECIES: FdtA/QdtA family cupin domain-containing protein [Flavobacterium]KAF2516904.1 WxcM-like domain-containing protein [Flavobacterium salilacus subsp. salilacus]MBE1615736.1 WxcM-like domain-containing protein [Flavobacterium sp. SaA2.13]NDI99872.1 WxcM-like domain-containing protein [Flavobacterium salilacus subsp. altitudinum]
MKTTINNAAVLPLPKIEDRRGNLSVIEGNTVPYDIKRVYYLYDVPGGAERGGHSHIEQQEFLIALSGSFEVIINDGAEEKFFMLNRPDKGLLIPQGLWRELKNFSSGAVCLVIASDVFKEADYIRDFDAFLESKK